MTDYKSITETAAILGVTRATIWFRIRLGQMKAVKSRHFPGDSKFVWAVPSQEVEKWQGKEEKWKRLKANVPAPSVRS